MTKKYIYNTFIAIFTLIGLYHLPACTMLADRSDRSTSMSTSVSSDLTDSVTVVEESETGKELCGNCELDDKEECDWCESVTHETWAICPIVNWPVGSDTGKCEIAYTKLPQLDCELNWTGELGCTKEEEDLYCKFYTKNEKAKGVAGDFIVSDYDFERGLWSHQSLNKDGIELFSLSNIYAASVFYYIKNPYLKVTKTMKPLSETPCFFPE